MIQKGCVHGLGLCLALWLRCRMKSWFVMERMNINDIPYCLEEPAGLEIRNSLLVLMNNVHIPSTLGVSKCRLSAAFWWGTVAQETAICDASQLLWQEALVLLQ